MCCSDHSNLLYQRGRLKRRGSEGQNKQKNEENKMIGMKIREKIRGSYCNYVEIDRNFFFFFDSTIKVLKNSQWERYISMFKESV